MIEYQQRIELLESLYDIKLVDYTYAEISNDQIKIHKDLYKYNIKLYYDALIHEIGHLHNNMLQDLVWDLRDLVHLRTHILAMGFYITRPKIILRMITPINIRLENDIIIEVNCTEIIIYSILILLFVLFWYIL